MVQNAQGRVSPRAAQVGLPLACMMVTFGMACFLERIPMAMGRTKVVMNLGLIGSWAGQVGPAHAPSAAAAATRHGSRGLCLLPCLLQRLPPCLEASAAVAAAGR